MIRPPIAGGKFYPEKKEELQDYIHTLFVHEKGPGSGHSDRTSAILTAAIVPHDHYDLSGPCAVHAYKEIAESQFADIYIILGTTHGDFHKSCFSMDDWQIPSGLVISDDEFGRILESQAFSLVPQPFNDEYSIEVQLPLLRFVSRDNSNASKLRIMPILIAEEDWEESAEQLKKVIDEYELHDKKVCIIVSSDMTHYGKNHAYLPFSDNVKENLEKLDHDALEFVKNKDVQGFLDYCSETGITICGKYPIAVLLSILKNKEKDETKEFDGTILNYSSSGEITGDYKNVISYAAVIFKPK